jgi:hypothetical protein
MGFLEKHQLSGNDGRPVTLLEVLDAIGQVDDENEAN